MNGLAGKVAIVTGAGTGIGQGIATRLGAEGAKVMVDYVGEAAGAEETRRAIEQAGGEAEIVSGDVTQIDDVRNLVDAIEELGYGVPQPVAGEDVEEQSREREYAALQRIGHELRPSLYLRANPHPLQIQVEVIVDAFEH